MDNSKLTRLDRIEGLRRENGLTLEQLAERTGLSSSVLSTYENDERKDISHRAVITLAEFYGVTTDYLLGLVEQKNHPDTEVIDLHLSDQMIAILKSGKINNRLLCEIVTHSKFHRLLVDMLFDKKKLPNGSWQDLTSNGYGFVDLGLNVGSFPSNRPIR